MADPKVHLLLMVIVFVVAIYFNNASASGVQTYSDTDSTGHMDRWMEAFPFSLGFGFLLYKAFRGYVQTAYSGEKNSAWMLGVLALLGTAAFVYYLMEFSDTFNNIPEDEALARKEDVKRVMIMSFMFFVLFYVIQKGAEKGGEDKTQHWVAKLVSGDWTESVLIVLIGVWYLVNDILTYVKGGDNETASTGGRTVSRAFLSVVVYSLVILYAMQPHLGEGTFKLLQWDGGKGKSGKVAEDFGSSYEI